MTETTNAPSTAKRSASPEALVDRLFVRLGAMYGKAWLDMWTGADIAIVKTEWARALYGVEPELLRLALNALLAEGRPFPPTLPEFVALCRQNVRKGAHRLLLTEPRTPPPSHVFDMLRKAAKAQKPEHPDHVLNVGEVYAPTAEETEARERQLRFVREHT